MRDYWHWTKKRIQAHACHPALDVLLVDDEPDFNLIVGEALADAGTA